MYDSEGNAKLRAERGQIDSEDARLAAEAEWLKTEKSRLQGEFLARGEEAFLQDAGSDAGAVRASIAWLHAGSLKLDADAARRSELIEENPIVASGHHHFPGSGHAHDFEVRLRDILIDIDSSHVRIGVQFYCRQCWASQSKTGKVPMRLIKDLDPEIDDLFRVG